MVSQVLCFQFGGSSIASKSRHSFVPNIIAVCEAERRSIKPRGDIGNAMQNSSYKHIQQKDWTSGLMYRQYAELFHVLPLAVVSCIIVLCLGILLVWVFTVFAAPSSSLLLVSMACLQGGRNRENMLRSDKRVSLALASLSAS